MTFLPQTTITIGTAAGTARDGAAAVAAEQAALAAATTAQQAAAAATTAANNAANNAITGGTVTGGNLVLTAVGGGTVTIPLGTSTGGITTVATNPLAVKYVGVAISGGENTYPGVFQPTSQTDYWISKGCNLLRFAVAWENCQRTLGATTLDASFMGNLDAFIAYATGKGVYVWIDCHNYGAYNGTVIGASGGPTSAQFAQYWGLMATRYKTNSYVGFGLMNEPIFDGTSPGVPAGPWIAICSTAMQAIRATGATNRISVPNTHYSAADLMPYTNIAGLMAAGGYTDSIAGGTIIEVHKYFDSDQTGTHAATISPSIGVEYLGKAIASCRANGFKMGYMEFGAGSGSDGVATLTEVFNLCQNNADVVTDIAMWGSGDFPTSYALYIGQINGVDVPQVGVLANYVPGGAATGVTALAPCWLLAVSGSPTYSSTTGMTGGVAVPQTSNSQLLTPITNTFVFDGIVYTGGLQNLAGNTLDFVVGVSAAGLLQIAVYNGTALSSYFQGTHTIASGATIFVGVQLNVGNVANATNVYLGINGATPTLEISVNSPTVRATTSATIDTLSIGNATGLTTNGWVGAIKRAAAFYSNSASPILYPTGNEPYLVAIWDFRQGPATGGVGLAGVTSVPPVAPTLTVQNLSSLTVGATATLTVAYGHGQSSSYTLQIDGTAVASGAPTFTNTYGAGATAAGTATLTFTIPAAGAHVLTVTGTGSYSPVATFNFTAVAAYVPGTSLTPAAAAYAIQRVGVNFSGGENSGGGIFPSTSSGTCDEWIANGATIIRLCAGWENWQPTLNGALSSSYTSNYLNAVTYLTGRGATVIVDCHNYAAYNGTAIGASGGPTNANLANFWGQVAAISQLKSNPLVVFSIMNEPGGQSTGNASSGWVQANVLCMQAIRGAGANNVVIVQTTSSDATDYFYTDGFLTAFKAAYTDTVANALVAEGHRYGDSNLSGTSATVQSNTIFVELALQGIAYCRQQGFPFFNGEFGAGSGTQAVTAVQNLYQLMQNCNQTAGGQTVWGCTQWGAWDFSGSSYPLALEPNGGTAQPQTTMLEQFVVGGSLRGTYRAVSAFPLYNVQTASGSGSVSYSTTLGATNFFGIVPAQAGVAIMRSMRARGTLNSVPSGTSAVIFYADTAVFGVNSAGHAFVNLYNGSSSVTIAGTAAIAAGSLVDIGVQFNSGGVTGKTALYLGINGATPTLIGTDTTLGIQTSFYNGIDHMNIGAAGTGNNQPWTGPIERVALFYSNDPGKMTGTMPSGGEADLGVLYDLRTINTSTYYGISGS